ncbi:MAG TPA: glycosyltransferase [Candidatus Bathyarchaeia archaeon]|nr:glycosyltransferase [Candidatus Bathyarchaeia archaeon]
MKIAVFHNLPPGGAKRVLYEEIRLLTVKNELHLFELELTDESFLDVRPFCEKIYSFPFEINSCLPGFLARLEKDYRNFVSLAALHKKIARQIDQGKFNFCLVHPDQLTQAPFLLKFLITPSIYFCQELLRIVYEKELAFEKTGNRFKNSYEELTRGIRKNIDKNNASSATRILTSSRYIQEKVKKAYKKKAEVCSLGVDTGLFKPYPVKSKDQVLFIGGNDKISGFDFAQNVFRLAALPGLRFKRIIFSKDFRDQDLVKEYSRSLVTLCTGVNEPFGLVALESMACRTPVLAVNEGGYRETVINGKTGFLHNRDPGEFAQKIKLFARNPSLVRKIGFEGRKQVIKKWTWQNHVQRLTSLMKKFDSE